jgi:hypothetical protein
MAYVASLTAKRWITYGFFVCTALYMVYTFAHVFSTVAPDFSVFYYSAKLLVSGRDIYTNSHLYTGLGYPPVTLFLYLPLSVFSYFTAQTVWNIGSMLAFVGSIVLCFRLIGDTSVEKILLAIAIIFWAFPTRFTFGMGQANFYALFLVLFGLREKEKHVWVQAVSLALAAIIKPQILFVFPALFFTSYRGACVRAIGIGLTAVVCSGLIFGWFQYSSYIHTMLPSLVPYANRGIYLNQSVEAAVARIFPEHIAYTISRISIGIILIISFISIIKRSSSLRLATVLLPAMVLVEPLGWQHHFIFFIPAMIQLWTQKNSWVRLAILLLASVSIGWNIKQPEMFAHSVLGTIVVSHVFWGGLAMWYMNVVS